MVRTSRVTRTGAALAVVVTMLLMAAGLSGVSVGTASAAGSSPRPSYSGEWAFGGSIDDVSGVAVSGSHVFVVGEVGMMRRYTTSGKLTGSWPLAYAPRSIATGPDGLLHVTQRWNAGRDTTYVHVYNRSGSKVRQYTLGVGVDWFPGDIGIDGAGNAYVTDTHDGTAGVHRFDRNGVYLGTISAAFGIDLEGVEGIGVANNGTFYVADTRNHRIVRFAPNGTATQWGQSGYGNGQFMSPHGVAVTPEGRVLVIDASTDRLQELTSSGKFVRHLDQGRLRRNDAVTVAPNGTVYVGGYLDSLVRGVARFSPPGVPGGAAGVTISKKKVKVRAKQKRAVVTLRCKAGTTCKGKVVVKQGKKTLAKANYRIAAGKKKSIRTKLTKTGRKATKRRPTAKVKVVVRTSHGAKVSRTTRLRR